MMMCLGLFVFTLSTTPFQKHEQSLDWRHPSTSRVGQRPATQYTGQGDESHALSGVLYPEVTGGRMSLQALKMMADTGKAWPLIEGTGIIHGLYVITALRITREVFFEDGAARKIEFDLQLKRIGQDPLDDLTDAIGNMLGSVTSEMMGLLL